jgi:hypothetical protein
VSDDDVLYGYRLRLSRSLMRSAFGLPAGRWVCTTRPTTAGSLKLSGQGSRFCVRASDGGLRCLISSHRLSSNGSLRSRSANPGWDRKRIAAQLARPEWGSLIVSANGVYKTLVRHGLNTRAGRLALVAGSRAPSEPPREPEPEPHVETDRPGELVGMDCFFVGRLHGATLPAKWNRNEPHPSAQLGVRSD